VGQRASGSWLLKSSFLSLGVSRWSHPMSSLRDETCSFGRHCLSATIVIKNRDWALHVGLRIRVWPLNAKDMTRFVYVDARRGLSSSCFEAPFQTTRKSLVMCGKMRLQRRKRRQISGLNVRTKSLSLLLKQSEKLRQNVATTDYLTNS
jgi:hypothetical protein